MNNSNEDLSFEELENDSEDSLFTDASGILQFQATKDPVQLLPRCQWNEIMPNVPDICPKYCLII